EELTAMSDEIVEKISGIEGIEAIGAMTGGGGMMSMGSSNDSVTMYLILDENSDVPANEISEQIMVMTKDMDCEVSADSSSSDMSSLFGSGISVQISGNDLDKLQEIAAQVAEVVEQTEGTVDVEDGLSDTTPSFTIVVDKEKAAKYGMTTAQVFQLVYAKMASDTSPTTITTDLKDYKVYIQTEEQSDTTLADIKNLTFTYTDRMGEKEKVALKDIAKFQEGSALNTINRDAQTRYISVTAGIDEEHNVTLVSNEIQKELKKLDLPEGYTIAMTGEDETINEAMKQLYLMLLLAVIFIYLIMVAQFQSFLSPFIIMFTIPLAFTGGFFTLFFTGKEVSVVAMIGFVMLAGIIVNNGIVMVDYINQLRRQGMEKREAIIESGKMRLRPILMTALTTILSMSTLALGLGGGSEMMQPMAIVTEGGLVYGTLLTLVVVPCIYELFTSNKSMVEEEL
ncbi:MAG: efflux RND transporter permease subunit, partial [Clostridiales bacterium]|nr:efflux RND transporter permease subunit [Clostridiales bacterium]